MNGVPILYCYMFRNIIASNRDGIIEYNEFVKALRKIIHKAPFSLYSEIAKEMTHYGFFEYANRKFIRVKTSKEIENNLRKLKDFIYPLTP